MTPDQWVVLIVFTLVFVGIFMEILDKSILVLAAAGLLVVTGYIDFHSAIAAIDFDTICLLLGMMLVVACLTELKIFDWLAIRLALITRGNPIFVFLAFALSSAVLSAFLDNVTTVLILIPLVIMLTRGIGLNPIPYVLVTVFLSNIGGAVTLIGDPPNVLIGSQVSHMTFSDFPKYMMVPVLISTVAALIFLKWFYSDSIQSRGKKFGWLFASHLMLTDFRRRAAELVIPRDVAIRVSVVSALILVGFFMHGAPGGGHGGGHGGGGHGGGHAALPAETNTAAVNPVFAAGLEIQPALYLEDPTPADARAANDHDATHESDTSHDGEHGEKIVGVEDGAVGENAAAASDDGHGFLALSPPVVAIIGAVLMVVAFYKRLDVHHLMHHVEWTTLLFFAGLFVVVGAAEHVGLLNLISDKLVSLTDNPFVLIMIVLWSSAIMSGIVDNIPFVAVMIPVLKSLLDQPPFSDDPSSGLVWWALVMGACFGGNATMILSLIHI